MTQVYLYLQFTDKETEAQELPEAIQLVNSGARIQTQTA
jgi:hypothetical protein